MTEPTTKKGWRGWPTAALALTGLGLIAGLALVVSPVLAQEGTITDNPLVERIRQALDDLVADEVITGEQADAVAETLAERFPKPRHHLRANLLETAAQAIGIERQELVDELREGATIAEVASAHQVDPQVVIEALVAVAEEHIEQAVENGRLEEERAEEMRAELPERMEDLVNGELRPGPRWRWLPRPGSDQPPGEDV